MRGSAQQLLSTILILVLVGGAPGAVLGQPPAPPAKERFEDVSRVVAVEVPVNVVGRDGQSIRGLKSTDFEIYDDGKKQSIESFEVVDLNVLSPSANPENRARAEQLTAPSRRHFLLLFDLSFSSVPAILKARLAARDFVLHSLAPTDLAAVATVSLERGPRLVVTFTPDRAQLARGIDTLGSKSDLAGERYDPLRFMVDQAQITAADASGAGQGQLPNLKDDRVGGVLGEYLASLSVMSQKDQRMFDTSRVTAMSRTLGSVAKSLSHLKGRKQVIFFSEGFDSRLMLGRGAAQVDDAVQEAQEIASGRSWMTDLDNRYGNTELQNEINRMLDLYKRADCVIQAVDIGGLRTAGGTGIGGGAPTGTGKEALFYFANETGGELFEDANNLNQQLQTLLERTSVTYLLTFERSDLAENGAYHRLRVKANLPAGSRLSHRSGYYAPRPFAELDPLEKNLLAAEGIASAAPRRELDLDVLVAPFRATPDLAYVPVIIEIGGGGLLTGQTSDRLGIEIYAYVSDAQGQMRDFFTQQVGLALGAGREAIKKRGVKYYGHLSIPPGSYRVRILVRNTETGRTGVESVPLEVPAFTSREPELLPPMFAEAPGSWVLVRQRESQEERSVVYPFTLKGEPYVPAARPSLAPEAQAQVYLVGYNFGPGQLAVQGQVVDDAGRKIEGGTLTLVERTTTGIAGLDKLVATFQPSGLKAGGYVLNVEVTDPTTGAHETNSLPFVVR
ncbi:MAG TPA: VWA domain-containing protein [Thermoanaerobaculia bacterium]|jgi:VWFA-related protein|nr:VWA domain-containing protein [Thermoanaerobaculia bacterium]